MAGHSKWANIKHRKARQDAVRGKAWSKCSRAIIVAAKAGGGDPDTNLALRYAIDEAKAANMPKDTIAKAIKKGSGAAADAENYEEVRYEGYGPNGVAFIVDCLTDNVQRTAPVMRRTFEKSGGNLGKSGAVSFGFVHKGLLLIEASKTTEDQLMELALDAGAEDVVEADGVWEVTCDTSDFIAVREAIVGAEIEPDSAEITMIPQTTVTCDASAAEKVLRLVDALEEEDDVQKVYHNAEIPDEVIANLGVTLMSDQQRIDVIFTGRVQGVFFRATTQEVARRFDVAGWVRNEPNGTVRMVAEGDAVELGRFLDAVQEAKRSNITDVLVTRPASTGEFVGFEIRY